MTLDEVIKRFSDNAEYERTHGNLQGCLEFRQLAEWLIELKRLKEQPKPCEDAISRQAVIETVDFYKQQTDGIFRINESIAKLPPVQPELNCKNCVFRTGYGTGIDEGILNALPKKMKEGE